MMKMAAINKDEIIERLKRRHGIEDDIQKEFIEDVVDEVIAYYLAIANDVSDKAVTEVPEQHSFIIRSVASKQYTRRGSEGLEEETVDGYRAKYAKSDFSEYEAFIVTEHKPKDDDKTGGKVVFI